MKLVKFELIHIDLRITDSPHLSVILNVLTRLYERSFMMFGLTNILSTFIQLINEVLKEFLSKFFIVYQDDILIFSKTLDDHLMHIHKVFDNLKEEKFLINLKKCSFVKKGVGVPRICSFNRRSKNGP